MKADKYKNKSSARFIPENEKHGKPDKRQQKRGKSKVQTVLKKVPELELEDLDDLDLDNFEKM